MRLLSRVALCAPDTRCWGRASLAYPLHLPYASRGLPSSCPYGTGLLSTQAGPEHSPCTWTLPVLVSPCSSLFLLKKIHFHLFSDKGTCISTTLIWVLHYVVLTFVDFPLSFHVLYVTHTAGLLHCCVTQCDLCFVPLCLQKAAPGSMYFSSWSISWRCCILEWCETMQAGSRSHSQLGMESELD